MYCSQCGSQITPESRVCGVCGIKTPEGQAALDGLFTRPTGITLLAILQFIEATFCFILGVALLLVADVPASPLLSALCLLLAGIKYFCGRGLWTLRAYGRLTQLGLSWIGLLGFPVGTVISVLILTYLYRPGMKVLFSGRPATEITPAEAILLANLERRGSGILAVTAALVMVLGIVVIGILAAMTIPGLLNAIDRGKQKRTMADMKVVRHALETSMEQVGHYPVSTELVKLEALEPKPGPHIHAKDAWTGDFYYQTNPEGSTYMLLSHGKDKRRSDASVGPTADFDCDIILESGTFTAYPEGIQT